MKSIVLRYRKGVNAMNTAALKLSRQEFDILVEYEKRGRKAAAGCEEKNIIPAEQLQGVLSMLQERGLIEENAITAAGMEALEPYRVKRAVFIAAGFGSRMVPITLNTPKPLVRVHGKRIIDTLLDAVVAAGIEEIIIVRGYLSEQFDQLLYKYPQIRFIENPSYNDANNIGSAMCVRYMLENAYVFEADLVLSNPELVQKYHYCSNFLGIPMERSDDWCFRVENGIIRQQLVGGLDCYQEVGISYWSAEDGAKLAEHIKETYEMPGGKERYWDQVPFAFFPDEYQVEIRPCTLEDIIEIDSFKELKQFDKTYDV